MKIDIPRIVRPLALAQYAEELSEAVVWVWANPTREFLGRWSELGAMASTAVKAKDEAGLRNVEDLIYSWFSECWSQGPDDATHWTAAEVKALAEHCTDTDPALWTFVQEGTLRLIQAHRARERKN